MSRFGHVPVRSLWFAAATALILAGCGDGNDGGGAPFDAEGTSNDVNAVSATFSSPAMASLGWAAGGIDGVFGAPFVSSSFGAIQDAAPSTSLAASARRVLRSATGFNARTTTSVALAVLPAEVLGKTFEYNSGTAQYEATERTGAPANGVRFILYAINPVTEVPVEPLAEAGYADVLDESTATANALRLQLVSGGTTYLSYGVTGSATATGGTVVVDGFATDGTTLVNFDLNNTFSEAANGTLGIDYRLDVPSRDLDLVYLIDVTQVSTPAAVVNVDASVSGPHGDVSIEGSLAAAGGQLTANVNGAAFAVVTLDENSQVASITKPDGSALTAAGVRCARRHLGRSAQGNRRVRGPARPDRQPALGFAEQTRTPGRMPGRFRFGASDRCYATLLQREPATSSATRSSLLRFAASAAKLVTRRCRRTDWATAFTSSRSAIGRPAIAARALAPSTRYCEARGPAPQSTYSFTSAGASASVGRVMRASSTAARMRPAETGIRRTRSWMPSNCSASSAGRISP